jgi:hypothetical protein
MAVLRRTLPTAIAIAVGIFVLVALFTSIPLLDAFGTYFVDTAIIIGAFALFLGLSNVLRVHARKIRERQSGSLYSLVLIVAMFVVLFFGLLTIRDQPVGVVNPVVQWIFEYIQVPIQASLSALLVFFMLTATYRLLRLRSVESAVMLVVVLLVLIGQVAVGLVPVLPEIKDWILNVPAMAGVRGILLGVALGTVLTGIRLLLGVERPYSD